MIHVIPAIDLIDGRCVRLSRGEFDQVTEYDPSPLDLATRYCQAGLRTLHFVDLDGARAGRPAQLSLIERIAESTEATIQLGGGIQSSQDIRSAFDAGVSRVIIGSAAVRDPALTYAWLDEFGPDRIVIAADSLDGVVRVDAWREASEIDVLDLLQDFHDRGAHWALCTDVARDGAMSGPAHDLYERIKTKIPRLALIASGGVRSAADVAALHERGVEAVVIGKSLLDGTIALEELEAFAC